MTEPLIVKFSTAHPEWPFLRQTAGNAGRVGKYQFVENENIRECDFWIVYGGLKEAETCACPAANTVFISTEPESVLKYEAGFLNQFATVITCQDLATTATALRTQQSMPWMVGARFIQETKSWSDRFERNYDDLKGSPFPEKQKLVSVITSSKTFTPGHALRLEFVQALSAAFPGQIDVFGQGLNAVEDKWDALAPYRYHIVIENSSYNDYWTEKLSDAILAGCYPIYHGCPNLDRYFSRATYRPIDIGKPDEAIRIIRSVLGTDLRETSLEALDTAKSQILDQYNVFPAMSRLFDSQSVGAGAPVTLRPQSEFVPLARKISNKARGLAAAVTRRMKVAP